MRNKLSLLTVFLLYVSIYIPAFSLGDKDKYKEKIRFKRNPYSPITLQLQH